jgi:hypothetical protein
MREEVELGANRSEHGMYRVAQSAEGRGRKMLTLEPLECKKTVP